MDTYIARANIDHYLGLLNSSDPLTPLKQSTITKLLIKEEDKLSHTLELLQFAEDRTAKGQERVARLRKLRDGLSSGSAEQAKADKLLANFEVAQQLMERFCDQMRQRVNGNGI